MSDKYNFYVEVKKIIPPLSSSEKYAAKVPYIVKNPGDNSERLIHSSTSIGAKREKRRN